MRSARMLIPSAAGLLLAAGVGLVLPDGWPFWAYMLAGAPFGYAGGAVGALWMRSDHG